jgi:hypothetical protein
MMMNSIFMLKSRLIVDNRVDLAVRGLGEGILGLKKVQMGVGIALATRRALAFTASVALTS